MPPVLTRAGVGEVGRSVPTASPVSSARPAAERTDRGQVVMNQRRVEEDRFVCGSRSRHPALSRAPMAGLLEGRGQRQRDRLSPRDA